MSQKKSIRGRGVFPSLLSNACLCAALVVAVALLWIPMCTMAYDVEYRAVKSPSPVTARFSGYCPSQSGGHTMMPMKESFQTQAHEAFSKAGFTEAAIGGWCPYSICTDNMCEWIFFTGLMNGTPKEKSMFFKGVVFKGIDHTSPILNMYNNFPKGTQPEAFDNVMGKTITKMTKNGRWENEMRDHKYSTWLCEFYRFTNEEQATAPVTDSNGYIVGWTKVKKFPWWGGLLIAIGVLLIVVIVVIVFCCYRKKKKEKAMKSEIERDMQQGDNIYRIPTQSQLGLSRRASMYQDVEDDGAYGVSQPMGYGPAGMSYHGSARMMDNEYGNPYNAPPMNQTEFNPYTGGGFQGA